MADLLLSKPLGAGLGYTLALGSILSLLNWLHPSVSGHLRAGRHRQLADLALLLLSSSRPAGSQKAQPDPVGRWRPLDRTLGRAGTRPREMNPWLKSIVMGLHPQ